MAGSTSLYSNPWSSENVVLTAAHRTDLFTAGIDEEGLGLDELRVSFDVAPGESSTYSYADRIVVHPDWFAKRKNTATRSECDTRRRLSVTLSVKSRRRCAQMAPETAQAPALRA